MSQPDIESLQQFIEQNFALFFVIMAWSLVWKGLALWKAAEKKDRGWFAAILILNTFGILEIVYLYFVSDRTKTS